MHVETIWVEIYLPASCISKEDRQVHGTTHAYTLTAIIDHLNFVSKI